MAQKAITAPQELLDQLADAYTFRDGDSVAAFLLRHPYLVDLLMEARGEIRKQFGPETPVVLQLSSDAEAEHDEELLALVLTPLPVDEALSRLDRLDETWWLDALDRAQDQLTIHVEFA